MILLTLMMHLPVKAVAVATGAVVVPLVVVPIDADVGCLGGAHLAGALLVESRARRESRFRLLGELHVIGASLPTLLYA